MTRPPYNPLDKVALAKSIEAELLRAAPAPLAQASNIIGAGVYAIYYAGSFDAYASIAARNAGGKFELPIYVGKAIPKGGRKGGLTLDSSTGSALAARLRKHATSIAEATNLDLNDFYTRHLVVEDIWIPLGENVLIETFQPLWNVIVDGFGNNDPGGRRATQFRSSWDTLHPGRSWSAKLAVGPTTVEDVKKRIGDALAGRPVPRVDERDGSDDEESS